MVLVIQLSFLLAILPKAFKPDDLGINYCICMLEKLGFLFTYSLWLSDWRQRRPSWGRSWQPALASLRKTFAYPNKFVWSLCLETRTAIHRQRGKPDGIYISGSPFRGQWVCRANEFVKKKYRDDTARKNIEVRKINTRMEQTKTCEDPAIAKAMSRMVDHQGRSVLKNASFEHLENIYIFTYSDRGFLIKCNMSIWNS